MSKIINTTGLTPFEVTIDPSVSAMVRFVRALIRTNAKVGSSQVYDKSSMKFLVWINPTRIAVFEVFCRPAQFQFVSNTAIQINGDLDPAKVRP